MLGYLRTVIVLVMDYDFLFLFRVLFFVVFFLLIRRPPRSTRPDTLFPYTTLFRSPLRCRDGLCGGVVAPDGDHRPALHRRPHRGVHPPCPCRAPPPGSAAVLGRHRCHHHLVAGRLRDRRGRLPVRGRAQLDRRLRDLLARRDRRHLAVPGRLVWLAVPPPVDRGATTPRPTPALTVACIPRALAELHRLVALLFSVGTGAITIWLLAAFETGEAGYQFEVERNWIADFGISWHVGIDGISLFLVVMSGLLFPLAMIAVTPHHDQKPYYAWLLLLQGACIGVFSALDLFVFFVMFELVLVPMYFLIGGWGYAERVYAALKFFIFTMLGSAFMLVGIVSLAFLHRDGERDSNVERVAEVQAEGDAQIDEIIGGAQDLDPNDPADAGQIADLSAQIDAITADIDARIAELENPKLDFDLVAIAEAQHVTDDSTSGNPLDWSAARWIFLAFAIAFAAKVPLFPLHTWLPDAHTQAPTAGSVILAAVLLKLGTYGFIRFGLYLFPEATVWFAPGMVTLGVIGIIYGAIVAAMRKDLKRLVAYSSEIGRAHV